MKIKSETEDLKTISLLSAKPKQNQLQLMTDDDITSRLKNVSPYDLSTWPDGDVIGLNESQYKAFRSALQREFAVIQGPPGTGKTYLGLKIAHTLLDNNHLWKEADDEKSCPILMLAYTNHALDSFLEGLTIDKKGIVLYIRHIECFHVTSCRPCWWGNIKYRHLTERVMNEFPLFEGIYPPTRECMKTLYMSVLHSPHHRVFSCDVG